MTAENDKPKSLVERLSDLEKLANGLAGYIENDVDKRVAQVTGAMRNMVEVINALITVSGPDFDAKVQEQIQLARDKRTAEAVEREKKMLEDLKSKGILEPLTTLESNCIVVGRELDKDGNPIPPGYVQVRFDQFTPQAQEQMLGKATGFILDLNGSRFEVQEAFRMVTPKPPEVTSGPESSTEQAPVAQS